MNITKHWRTAVRNKSHCFRLINLFCQLNFAQFFYNLIISKVKTFSCWLQTQQLVSTSWLMKPANGRIRKCSEGTIFSSVSKVVTQSRYEGEERSSCARSFGRKSRFGFLFTLTIECWTSFTERSTILVFFCASLFLEHTLHWKLMLLPG